MITRREFGWAIPLAAASARRLRAANVDGTWEAEIESPRGPTVVRFVLRADADKLTGTVGNEAMGESEIQDGKVTGDQVSFVQVMTRGDFEMRIRYEGTVREDELELTRTMGRPPGARGGGPGGQGPGRRVGPGPGGPGGGGGGRPGGGGPGGPGGNRGGPGRAVTFTARRVP